METRNKGVTLGAFLTSLFSMPNIQGRQYAPGWQPNSPGNSSTPGWSGGTDFHVIPWPNVVPTLNALANDPGIARQRAIIPENNRYSFLPEHYLFIAGFVGKSQG